MEREHRLLGERSVGGSAGDRALAHRMEDERRVVPGAHVLPRALFSRPRSVMTLFVSATEIG